MKRGIALALLITGCSFAAVRGDHAAYVGGTVKEIPQDTTGRLDLDDAKLLRFDYKGGSYSIPYADVTSIEFGQKAGRRVGLAVLISPAFLFSEKKRHFLTIGFSNLVGWAGHSVNPLGPTASPVTLVRRSSSEPIPQEGEG